MYVGSLAHMRESVRPRVRSRAAVIDALCRYHERASLLSLSLSPSAMSPYHHRATVSMSPLTVRLTSCRRGAVCCMLACVLDPGTNHRGLDYHNRAVLLHLKQHRLPRRRDQPRCAIPRQCATRRASSPARAGSPPTSGYPLYEARQPTSQQENHRRVTKVGCRCSLEWVAMPETGRNFARRRLDPGGARVRDARGPSWRQRARTRSHGAAALPAALHDACRRDATLALAVRCAHLPRFDSIRFDSLSSTCIFESSR